jgi:hypothetical protein
MKLKPFLPLLILLFSLSIKAQEAITLGEDSLMINKSLLPGMSVNIPEADHQKTLDSWIKTLQSGTRSTVVTENGEMTIFGANIRDVSGTPLNVYSRLAESDSALRLGVAFELSKDVYIEKATGDAEYTRAKSFIFNFAKNQYISVIEEQLKAEDSKLKDLEKELSSLERDGSGMEKTVRKSDRIISSEESKLADNNNRLTSLTAAISQHSMELPSIGSPEERETKEEYLKDLEKEKKKTLKAITKSEKKIRKAERALGKAKSNIPKIDRNQDDVKKRIDDQAAVVQQYTEKLNQVKNFGL